MDGRARRAEVVGSAPQSDHQRIVGDAMRWQHFTAGVIDRRGEMNLFIRSIQAIHSAQAELKMMPPRLVQVIQFVIVQIHAACGNLVQQRLPQMRARSVDQGYARRLALPQRPAELSGQFEPAGPASYDNDSMQVAV